MSHTGRAIYVMTYEPSNLTTAQAAFVNRQVNDDSQPAACPSSAPTETEHREHRNSLTTCRIQHADLHNTIADMIF